MIEPARELTNAILEADRSGAKDILEAYAEAHGYWEAAQQVLEVTLVHIGDLWEKTGDVSLAQAFVAAKVAEDFMAAMAEKEALQTPESKEKGIVVIGNIEEDFHSLGRNMVTVFLEKDGWQVIDLGNDVLAEEFVDKAVEIGADIIAASAMMYTTAVNIRKIREELDRRGLSHQIKLAVGGAVFRLRPELLDEVGGDGTAPNAIKAPEVFAKLWQDLRKGESS